MTTYTSQEVETMRCNVIRSCVFSEDSSLVGMLNQLGAILRAREDAKAVVVSELTAEVVHKTLDARCEHKRQWKRSELLSVGPTHVEATPFAYVESYRLSGEKHMDLVWSDDRDDREYEPLFRHPPTDSAEAKDSAKDAAKVQWLFDQSAILSNWCNTAGSALNELMDAYERRIRSDCHSQEDLDKQPWRCSEYLQAMRALLSKPVPFVTFDTAMSAE